ncbi:hypothetical protein PR048_001101 [Dryococelus australis]|uniref:Uncharacterized protein n=1 Tax=Dryococelus australis TaxID=614101 RepID=A0ABQ9IIV6_9NEOP|nr:hypothetical protein PR048_001101 [Dryococelus australis]
MIGRLVNNPFQFVSSCKMCREDIVKKCEQAVADHEAYLVRYRQCSAWLAEAQAKFDKCRGESGSGARPDLLHCSTVLQELLMEQPSASSLLNTTVELGEKLYPSTAVEGRETVRQQLQELQHTLESLYDATSSLERELQAKLSRWSGFEECSKNLRRWLSEVEAQLPAELELKATLDEKRAQLQTYRALLHDAVAHQQDIVSLRDKTESLPERNDKIDQQLQLLTEQHASILKRAQMYLERRVRIKTLVPILNWRCERKRKWKQDPYTLTGFAHKSRVSSSARWVFPRWYGLLFRNLSTTLAYQKLGDYNP